MADSNAYLEDLRNIIGLMKEERKNLLEHLKQQECNFDISITDLIKCFQDIIEEKDRKIKELTDEISSLKKSGN